MRTDVIFLVATAILIAAHVRALKKKFPNDFGCCQPVNCVNGYSQCPDTISQCLENHYARKCPGCCDACENFLQQGEICWKAMDLGYCRLGKCRPPLICSQNGSCLPPEIGIDWGRGDEYSPFEED